MVFRVAASQLFPEIRELVHLCEAEEFGFGSSEAKKLSGSGLPLPISFAEQNLG